MGFFRPDTRIMAQMKTESGRSYALPHACQREEGVSMGKGSSWSPKWPTRIEQRLSGDLCPSLEGFHQKKHLL